MKGFRFVVAVFVLYAWLFPWLPELKSPNELARLYQTRAIVDDGTLVMNGVLERHGHLAPHRLGDLSVKDGRYYSSKAPGVSFAGVPVYALLRLVRGGEAEVSERACLFFLRLFTCMLPAAFAAELLRRILERRFGEGLALAGAVSFALGSLMWPYSTQLVSHGAVTVALVGCWYALDRARDEGGGAVGAAGRSSARRFLVAGCAAGCAVLLEYTGALALPLLALYGLSAVRGLREKGRAAAWAVLGAMPPLAALALYHTVVFGGPFETSYRHLDSDIYMEWHHRGFMGLGLPRLEPLLGSFFDPARGLFCYAPFLALAIPGLVLLWRKDRALASLTGGALAFYAYFTAGFVYESWGWSVGPRHLTPLGAFLVPPALAAAAWLRDRGWGVVTAALAIFSVGVFALVGVTVPYFPPELTNPVHQLCFTLGVAGFKAHDVLGMALGAASFWTLLPWALGLLALAAFAFRHLVGERYRWVKLAGAAVLAGLLFIEHGNLGGPDHFGRTRLFMLQLWEPRPGRAPGVFSGP